MRFEGTIAFLLLVSAFSVASALNGCPQDFSVVMDASRRTHCVKKLAHTPDCKFLHPLARVASDSLLSSIPGYRHGDIYCEVGLLLNSRGGMRRLMQTPTEAPTPIPSATPSTDNPTPAPFTPTPSATPTSEPTTATPTAVPTTATPTTATPTATPTTATPTATPTTASPTNTPTATPTTASPTNTPTIAPTTASPTFSPTYAPTTATPTSTPTTSSPSNSPTATPTTAAPTAVPTKAPTTWAPTSVPTKAPSTGTPTLSPTKVPTETPTVAAGNGRTPSPTLPGEQVLSFAQELAKKPTSPRSLGFFIGGGLGIILIILLSLFCCRRCCNSFRRYGKATDDVTTPRSGKALDDFLEKQKEDILSIDDDPKRNRFASIATDRSLRSPSTAASANQSGKGVMSELGKVLARKQVKVLD